VSIIKAMRRTAILSTVIFFGFAGTLWCVNPDDLKFELRLTSEVRVFHAGESIPLEMAFSSESDKKYYGSFSNPIPEMAGQEPEVTPADGFVHLKDLREGFAGSILSSDGYLTPKPHTLQLDLSGWFRFTKSGHYLVRMKARNISRIRSTEEGGGREPLTLESNAIEFDIVAEDPAWAATELEKIEEELSARVVNTPEWNAALTRLSRLDTPASVRRLAQMHLSGPESSNRWQVDNGLRYSTQLDVVIPLLVAALADPSAHLPNGIADLLAGLETRKEMGVLPRYTGNAAQEQEFRAKLDERRKVRDRYFQQANDLLLASLEKRPGPQRAEAIFQAWSNAEMLNSSNGVSPETLARLRASVLAFQDDLPPAMQYALAFTGWQTLPHAQLLPLVRKLGKESLNGTQVRYDALQRWCEAAPDECSAAIIDLYLEAPPKPYSAIILLLPEAEHAELDDLLARQLHDGAANSPAQESQSVAAMVLRAGSRQLVPKVTEMLDKGPVGEASFCGARADLLGYLFRFTPKQAAKRLNSELQSAKNGCGAELLRMLHNHRYSDDELPAALAALNAPNVTTAGYAALFLQEHGPSSVEEALWRRLELFRSAWHARSAEVKAAIGETPQAEAAKFEQALASALTHARNWKLSPGEIERLRQGCLTDQCRDIADGKMALGL
jgi:hypothetical protein